MRTPPCRTTGRDTACPVTLHGTDIEAGYRALRGPLRGVREQSRPGPDARALPALPGAERRVAEGLAADVRRRGRRVGRRARHGRPGARRRDLRDALRRLPAGREGARRVGGRRHSRGRHLRQAAGPGLDPGGRRARLDLRARRVRGRAAVVPLPGAARRSRGEGRGARRLRRRAARRMRECQRAPRPPDSTGQPRSPSSAASVSSRTPTPMLRSSTSKPGWCRSYGGGARRPHPEPGHRAGHLLEVPAEVLAAERLRRSTAAAPGPSALGGRGRGCATAAGRR